MTKEYLKKNGILVSIAAALSYWMIKTTLDSYLFSEGTFFALIFPSDPNTLWMRFEFTTIIISFGIYIQLTFKKTEAETHFLEIFKTSVDAVVMTNSQHRITLFNPSAEKIFGYSASEVLGKPITLLMPKRFGGPHPEKMDTFSEKGPTAKKMGERSAIIYGQRKNGEEFPANASISRLKKDGGILFTAFLRDITEQVESMRRIRSLAFYDQITDLPNRVYFLDLLQQELQRDEETENPVALLLIDIDHFREINATLGHSLGDILLKDISRRLKSILRPGDTLSRLGGDEFAFILPLANKEDAEVFAKKISEAMMKPFTLNNIPVLVETSIGIATSPSHGSDAALLLQRADVAMYTAKGRGLGFFVYDSDIDPHSPRRLTLMGSLRDAIENNQLRLHFQPKVDLHSKVIFGVEALVRWEHP